MGDGCSYRLSLFILVLSLFIVLEIVWKIRDLSQNFTKKFHRKFRFGDGTDTSRYIRILEAKCSKTAMVKVEFVNVHGFC